MTDRAFGELFTSEQAAIPDEIGELLGALQAKIQDSGKNIDEIGVGSGYWQVVGDETILESVIINVVSAAGRSKLQDTIKRSPIPNARGIIVHTTEPSMAGMSPIEQTYPVETEEIVIIQSETGELCAKRRLTFSDRLNPRTLHGADLKDRVALEERLHERRVAEEAKLLALVDCEDLSANRLQELLEIIAAMQLA